MPALIKEDGARGDLVLAKSEAPEKGEVGAPSRTNENEETPVSLQFVGNEVQQMEGGVGPEGAQLAPRGAKSVWAPRIRTEQSVMFTTKQVSEGLWGGEGRQDGREKARADLIVIQRRPWVSLHVPTKQRGQGR